MVIRPGEVHDSKCGSHGGYAYKLIYVRPDVLDSFGLIPVCRFLQPSPALIPDSSFLIPVSDTVSEVSKPPTAFIAAGVVLLAMPLLMALGIGVLGLTAGLPDTDPTVSRVMLTGFLVWIVIVTIAVTVFLAMLLRKSPRS